MSELAQLQQDFQEYLLNPKNKHVIKQVNSTKKIRAKARMQIYANAYRLRLLEALEDNYRMLHRFMGAEMFTEMGNDYIDLQPSQFSSIRWFGDQLPVFIREHAESDFLEVVAEMAEFEWALTVAFDARDAVVMSLAKMSQISPEKWADMQLQFHPSVQRLNFTANIGEIWNALQQEQEPAIQQEAYPVGWVIWRQSLDNYFRSMEVSEAWAMDALLQGQTFGDVCEGLIEWIDERHAPEYAASLLNVWVHDGLITDVTT